MMPSLCNKQKETKWLTSATVATLKPPHNMFHRQESTINTIISKDMKNVQQLDNRILQTQQKAGTLRRSVTLQKHQARFLWFLNISWRRGEKTPQQVKKITADVPQIPGIHSYFNISFPFIMMSFLQKHFKRGKEKKKYPTPKKKKETASISKLWREEKNRVLLIAGFKTSSKQFLFSTLRLKVMFRRYFWKLK